LMLRRTSTLGSPSTLPSSPRRVVCELRFCTRQWCTRVSRWGAPTAPRCSVRLFRIVHALVDLLDRVVPCVNDHMSLHFEGGRGCRRWWRRLGGRPLPRLRGRGGVGRPWRGGCRCCA
jgi:hypothetical protein